MWRQALTLVGALWASGCGADEPAPAAEPDTRPVQPGPPAPGMQDASGTRDAGAGETPFDAAVMADDGGARGDAAAVPDGAAAAPDGAVSDVRLRIATWNIAWLRSEPGAGPVSRDAEDYRRLARYANRLDADVIAFQEIESAQAALRVFDAEHYAVHMADETDVQRTGFAYRRSLDVVPYPDVEALDLHGGLRRGAQIGVRVGPVELRLLNVHLKAGCFSGPLHSDQDACRKLGEQLVVLEEWIDTRAQDGTPFAVLGDFNRRFEDDDDPFWRAIDDGEPLGADLSRVTRDRLSTCWGWENPFIEHIVLDTQASAWVDDRATAQAHYDGADAEHEERLSDHCPLVTELEIPKD